jgi:hypothetical protein
VGQRPVHPARGEHAGVGHDECAGAASPTDRVADLGQAADAEDGLGDEELLQLAAEFHGSHLVCQRNRGPDICHLVQTY